jgi:beta-glucanase (GH16 family)
MRNSITLFTLLVLLVSCKQTQKLTSTPSKSNLIWSDEFSKNGLPDSTKWDYEVGFVRNGEQQYYTKARKENANVENGMLVITTLKEEYKNGHYTSASLNTLGKTSFEGDIRVEVKAKLPSGQGIWPAIWMMGTNIKKVGWPKCSELDIMEYVSVNPNTVHGTLHWWDSVPKNKSNHLSKGASVVYTDLSTNFHVYGLERRGNVIKLFVDDNYYNTVTPPATAFPGTFVDPLYLLINTALGGWGGKIDDSIFPQKFYFDYVRVYRLPK